MLVSEIEKNPETNSRTTSAPNSVPNGMSSIRLTAQNHLEYEFAADIREHEGQKTGERVAHRDPAAPAVHLAPDEQCAEDEPRNEAENRLVIERRGLAENLFREYDA